MSANGGEREDSLIVDNQPAELARVHAWVHDWAQRQHLPASVARNLDLCSTEVVTNIMTHGAGGNAQHIHLRLGWQGQAVALEVEDEGDAFDPRQVPAPQRPTSLQD